MPVKRYIEQTDRNRCYFFDDFGGGNYDNRTWGVIGSVGGGAAKIAAIGGQVQVTVPATAGSTYALHQDSYGNFNVSGPCEVTWRAQIVDITNLQAQFGLRYSTSNYIVLMADSSISASWLAQCTSGGVSTQVDTGWRVDAGVWVQLQILVSTSSVRFFINDSLRATIATNIPTQNLGPLVYLYRNAGGAGTRAVLADWCEAIGGRA